MSFHEIILAEIQRNSSLKILQLFAKGIREARQAAAMHPQRMILLFNVRRTNAIHVGHAGDNRLFSFSLNWPE